MEETDGCDCVLGRGEEQTAARIILRASSSASSHLLQRIIAYVAYAHTHTHRKDRYERYQGWEETLGRVVL